MKGGTASSSKKDSALVARDRRRRGLGGPSNSGVISTKSGAGLTRIMFFVSKELGLKLQETTQQVVKEMRVLLHTLLSKFGGLAVLTHQILLPKRIALPGTREVVSIVVGGGRKTTIKEDGVVHLRRRHGGVKVGRGGGVVVVRVGKGGKIQNPPEGPLPYIHLLT